MSKRAEAARSFFESGYNCAQSVAMAFNDILSLSESEAAKYTIGFGGGMGRMREVCGTVSGMTFVISTLYSNRGTAKVYDLVQKAAGEFKEQNGSIICRELLHMSNNSAPTSPQPSTRTTTYYKKRPCSQLVYDATTILENLINENPIK